MDRLSACPATNPVLPHNGVFRLEIAEAATGAVAPFSVKIQVPSAIDFAPWILDWFIPQKILIIPDKLKVTLPAGTAASRVPYGLWGKLRSL